MRTAILICFLLVKISNAQIVNIERLRLYSDKKIQGDLQFNFSAVKNTREILNFNNNAIIQLVFKNSSLSFFENYSWMQINKTKIISNGFQHLRFTFRRTKTVQPEILLQNQQNAIWDIDTRILGGVGALFMFAKSDTFLLSVGTYLLYEYEDLIKDPSVNKNLRISISPHLSYKKTNTMVSFILYYQPIPNYIYDYRINAQIDLFFKVFKQLYFSNTFSVNYDTKPPVNLPNLFYRYYTGVGLKF